MQNKGVSERIFNEMYRFQNYYKVAFVVDSHVNMMKGLLGTYSCPLSEAPSSIFLFSFLRRLIFQFNYAKRGVC